MTIEALETLEAVVPLVLYVVLAGFGFAFGWQARRSRETAMLRQVRDRLAMLPTPWHVWLDYAPDSVTGLIMGQRCEVCGASFQTRCSGARTVPRVQTRGDQRDVN